MKNVLAVALVVSATSMALSQNPVKNAPAAIRKRAGLPAGVAPAANPAAAGVVKQPQRWEYKVSDRGGFEPGDWQKKLNDLAAEGWELDAVDEGHYILRRPVQRLPAGIGFIDVDADAAVLFEPFGADALVN